LQSQKELPLESTWDGEVRGVEVAIQRLANGMEENASEQILALMVGAQMFGSEQE
jgi:hypothetical protein